MKKQWLTVFLALSFSSLASADEMSFPKLLDAGVKGAPKLSKPFMVMGYTKPVLTEKHGLAAPALWDWDGDGKRDLLVGEFETCTQNSKPPFPWGEKGSSIRVYLNVGSDSNPKFTDEFFYARDTEGVVIEVPQWCCIGFTPQFVDLNNDGYLDMIAGQYHPGDVTMFAGTGEGFKSGVILEQEGDSSVSGHGMPESDIRSFGYWNYSSASFGDFDDDGDQDLIIGGYALRISENIGSKGEPKFARRELLLDINGQPLVMKHLSDRDKAKYAERGGEPPPSGSGKIQQVVTDWDNDGVLDILATDYYLDSGSRAVSFFRGVKTKVGHRFEQGIDLLPAKGGAKALPGSGNRLYVDDWNKDGIKDLIVGASVATVNGGEFSDELSWQWESINKVQSAGKDPGRYPPQEKPTFESLKNQWSHMTDEQINEMLPAQLKYWEGSVGKLYKEGKGHWLTMRHQGRVYVFLGENSGTKARATKVVNDKSTRKKKKNKKRTPPVQFAMVPTTATSAGSTVELIVNVDVRKGWYIYAPTGRNEPNGMVETAISYDLPEGFEMAGDMILPPHHPKGMFEIYDGKDIKLTQPVKVSSSVKAGEYTINGQLRYQSCNKEICLPPRTEKIVATIVVK